MLKILCKVLTLFILCSVARAEFIAPNSKTLFVLPTNFFKKYEKELPEIRKLVQANLKRKYFITANFIKSFSKVDVPEAELKNIRDKYPTYQYFFLLGETENKYFLKLLDYRLKTLFVKTESNYNQPVIKFLNNAFSSYEGDIFFNGNIIKAESPNQVLIKAENNSGVSLVGKAVYIYPSSILNRSTNYKEFPKGAILERVGSFYRAQIINPSNVPIKSGDHIKVMKFKTVGTSSKGIRQKLQKGGVLDPGKTSNDFDVTYRKFSYVFPYQNSLFICYLSPFVSNVKSETAREIREEVLLNIKDDKICQARINESMEKLLFARKGTLAKDLYNPKVLKLLLDKLKAGSILRPSVLSKGAGLFVKLEVIVQDGKTVIFNKSTILPTKDIEPVINVLTIWLKEYQKSIPYVALVEEAVGDQLLLQIGEEQDIGNTQHYEIYRPLGLKIESFEDIYKVTWEKEKLGNGTIRDKKGNSAIAYVRNTEPNAKIRKGDWITFTDDYFLGEDDANFIKHNINIKRDVGKVHIALEASQLTGDSEDNTANLFGADLGIDYYLPYSIIGIFSFKRIAGSGDFSSSASFFDGALGYAIKPPFKFFSYIDGFIGYKSSKYDLTELNLTGVGELSFSGPYLGARMEVPIYKKLSILGSFKISPFDSADNTGALDPDSASGYTLELRPQFHLNKKWGLFTSLTYHTHNIENTDGSTTNLNVFVTNLGVNYYY